ncbi:MAG: DUF3422 family protein [Geminicoccaceae bacterium]
MALLRAGEAPVEPDEVSGRWFDGNPLVGAEVAGGAAVALSDFRIGAEGFSRLVLFDRSMAPRQAGRTVQRLLELDTYRVLALLALPLARETAPVLSRLELELAQITKKMTVAHEADEPVLLDRLTRLDAEIEGRESDTHFRFSAAGAYHGLVLQRIEELREGRIPGLQTFREFIERRLAPAMNTCNAIGARQEALSTRVARATQLLSTRVDITRERQNQAVLESMNRRAKLQLRLQQTVEGLSVVAITYYLVSLVGYGAKGLEKFGVPIEPNLATAVCIPIVAVLLALGIGRVRRSVMRKGR